MTEYIKLDPVIKSIEDEIIEYLVESPIFIGEDIKLRKIRAYFITRKDLTQTEIQQLTHYSAGTVSQALKEIVNRGYLEKIQRSSTSKIIYNMDSIELSFLTSFLEGLNEMEGWKEGIQEIKLDLEKNKEEFQDLNGYDALNEIITLFFNSFIIIKPIIDMLKSERDTLENKR